MAFVGIKPFATEKGLLTIQSARPCDAEEFIEYIKRVDGETDFLARGPGEFSMSVEEERRFIESKFSSNRELLLAARLNGKIVGTLGLMSYPLNRYSHKAQFGLSVLKEFWGIGIGRRLIETMIEWADANGLVKVTLEVDTLNTRAYNLYKSFGFKKEGCLRMDRIMGSGEFRDTYLMARFNPYYNKQQH